MTSKALFPARQTAWGCKYVDLDMQTHCIPNNCNPTHCSLVFFLVLWASMIITLFEEALPWQTQPQWSHSERAVCPAPLLTAANGSRQAALPMCA